MTSALETQLKKMIADTKKEFDKSLNTVRDSLMDRINRLEEENTQLRATVKAVQDKEELLTNEVQNLQTELKQFKENGREEGEISPEVIADLAELKKAHAELKLTTSLAVAETVEKMETCKKSWVEAVKETEGTWAKEWTLVKEKGKKVVPNKAIDLVNATLEEERMRQARRLNVRVTGIVEKEGTLPADDGKALCKILGYDEEEEPPYAGVWRVGTDYTRSRALILQFKDEITRITFLKKRVILRGLKDQKIYLDDDLTPTQIAHRKQEMPKVLAARNAGKKAVYRDGHVFIDGKMVA